MLVVSTPHRKVYIFLVQPKTITFPFLEIIYRKRYCHGFWLNWRSGLSGVIGCNFFFWDSEPGILWEWTLSSRSFFEPKPSDWQAVRLPWLQVWWVVSLTCPATGSGAIYEIELCIFCTPTPSPFCVFFQALRTVFEFVRTLSLDNSFTNTLRHAKTSMFCWYF